MGLCESAARGRRALRAFVGPLAAGLTTALLAGTPSPLAGQFAVSPVIVQLPHDSAGAATTLRIDNESDDLMHFRVYARDFDQDDDGAHRFADLGSLERSCADRLRFAPDALALAAGARAIVQVRLEPGADPTCWSMLFVEAPASTRGAVRLNQRIGVKIYGLGPAPGGSGTLAAAAAQPLADSLDVRFVFDNPGDWPLRPEGMVEIRDPLGGVLRSVPIHPFSVLPGRQRHVRVALSLDSLPAGRYLAVPILDFGAEFLAGAQVEFRLDD